MKDKHSWLVGCTCKVHHFSPVGKDQITAVLHIFPYMCLINPSSVHFEESYQNNKHTQIRLCCTLPKRLHKSWLGYNVITRYPPTSANTKQPTTTLRQIRLREYKTALSLNSGTLGPVSQRSHHWADHQEFTKTFWSMDSRAHAVNKHCSKKIQYR